MTFEGFPHIVGWELTLLCNLRCRHCASAAGLPRDDELTTEEAFALVDQFPALAVREVHFTGGEPLMRRDWWRIAARVAEKGIATRIVTNGSPLVPAVIERIRDVGIKTVGISLDGLEATHDHVRQMPGLFRRVLAAIERVQAAGVSVGVITAVNARNLGELPALLSLLQQIGVHHWQLQPNLPQGRSEESTDLHLSPEDYLKLGAFFHANQPKALERGLQIVPADSLGYFTELDLADAPWRGCPAGLYSVAITSDGRVTGCLTMPESMVEGNLREADLWDIWFREGAFPYTRGFSLDRMGPECQGCQWAEQCRGGCTSMSKVCTGCYHNDPYCFHGIERRQPRLMARVLSARTAAASAQ
ncbi:MAG TPA: radical SAM protein [Thermoanaerobaculia bacterium]|nr:radical SAM protein [Thermoanaerobaculia bacterium]